MPIELPLAANANGLIQFDVRVHTSIKKMEIRKGILDVFKTRLLQLSGLSSESHLTKLAKYASHGITDPAFQESGTPIPGLPMPTPASAMLDYLNGKNLPAGHTKGYLRLLCDYCLLISNSNCDPFLQRCIAVELSGSDHYCVGPDGRIYCYHHFGLIGLGTDEPEVVEYDSVQGTVVLTCIAAVPQYGIPGP